MNTTNFTSGQIQWASGHDWFNHNQSNQSIVVCYEDYTINGLFKTNLVSFTSFKQLRDWAGY